MNESWLRRKALSFLLIVVRSPSRELEQGRPSELAAPAVGGHAGVGEVAVEHQGADAHAWGCSARPEVARSGLATKTSGCYDCCSGGCAFRRFAGWGTTRGGAGGAWGWVLRWLEVSSSEGDWGMALPR